MTGLPMIVVDDYDTLRLPSGGQGIPARFPSFIGTATAVGFGVASGARTDFIGVELPPRPYMGVLQNVWPVNTGISGYGAGAVNLFRSFYPPQDVAFRFYGASVYGLTAEDVSGFGVDWGVRARVGTLTEIIDNDTPFVPFSINQLSKGQVKIDGSFTDFVPQPGDVIEICVFRLPTSDFYIEPIRF